MWWQLLVEAFSDANAPGLKGKLKLFVLGISLGHPVAPPTPARPTPGVEPPVAQTPVQSGVRVSIDDARTHSTAGVARAKEEGRPINVLRGTRSGGLASIFSVGGEKRGEQQTRPERGQEAEALLDDQGHERFRAHLSLSYRQEPLSGVVWSKWSSASAGILVPPPCHPCSPAPCQYRLLPIPPPAYPAGLALAVAPHDARGDKQYAGMADRGADSLGGAEWWGGGACR